MNSSIEQISFYQKRVDEFSDKLKLVKRRINIISNSRLVIAAAFIATIYVGRTNNIYFYLLFPLVIIFIYLMQRHAKIFAQKTHLENLVRCNQKEIQILNRDFKNMDTGLVFTQARHPYERDLDLFGEESVFQYLNRCNTLEGKKNLAARLLTPPVSRENLLAHQQAVKELTDKVEFRQHVQAASMEMEEQPNDRLQLTEWLKHPSFVYGKSFYKVILILVPVSTIMAIVASFYIPTIKSAAILLALFQWAFLGFHLKRVNAFHEYISKKNSVFKRYAQLLRIVSEQQFSSSVLQELTNRAHEAASEVNRLASLVNALDARANSMMNLLVNSTLLYDLQCVYRLEQWRAEHASKLEQWLGTVTEAEVLCALGTFAFNHPSYVYPQIEEGDLIITAKALGHPLIPQHECVHNDVLLGGGQRIHIITGANMAGKSTYLRTIGVNMVLAYIGVPVCADSFRCSLVEMRSGMRASDSLKDHQSYFYAELDRLKTIMDELRSGKPLLILLDEMLKGTNSNDKLAGSIALVKQLLPNRCLAMVATHDLALGELEKTHPDSIRNFCFEALIENDQLSFDYKLKEGLAQNLNATFLMRKMGIIPKD